MMTMKTAAYIVLALAIPFAANAGQKQPKNTADSNQQGIERMAKELGLNEEQKAKVEVIFNAEREKVEAIFSEQQEKLQAVQQETRTDLEAVLTPEQMAILDKKMSQQSSRKTH